MLEHKPHISQLKNEINFKSNEDQAALKYAIKLAILDRPIFALKAAQNFDFIQFYLLDIIFVLFTVVVLLSFLLV